MIVEGPKEFSPVYSSWFGKPVVMLVVIRQYHVPMSCHIVGESAADVRVRIQPGWEMDIRKNLIIAVEEVAVATQDRGIDATARASIVPLPTGLSVRPLETRVAETVSKTLTMSQLSRRSIFAN